MKESTRDRALRLAKEAEEKDKVPLIPDQWDGLTMTVAELETLIRLARNEALEEAAVTAWLYYADTCLKQGINPHNHGRWISSNAIRAMKEES